MDFCQLDIPWLPSASLLSWGQELERHTERKRGKCERERGRQRERQIQKEKVRDLEERINALHECYIGAATKEMR